MRLKKAQPLKKHARPQGRRPSSRKRGKVKKWGINGEGIVYDNKKVVFVEGAIPEELIEYSVSGQKPGYATGKLLRVLEPSPRRRVPMCALQDICGGCSIMHLDYRGQIQMKKNILKQSLEKYAGYRGPVEEMLRNPSPLGYRNAIKLPFGYNEEGKVQSGMYQRGSNDFVAVDHCLIHAPKLEKVRKEIDELIAPYNLPIDPKAKGSGLITLVLKEFNDQVYVVLVTSDLKIPEELQEKILNLEDVKGLWQSIKTTEPEYELYGKQMIHLGGEMDMNLDLEEIQMSLTPRSFFQLNTKQAIVLYKTVAEWVRGAKSVLELYCGVGAISLFIADQVEEVVGIELVEDAVSNARQNALMNARLNASFICGDAGTELKKLLKTKHFDVIIVDPPRKGLDELMKKELLKSGADRIIYVSCNPSTLAKDIDDLSSKYQVKKVQPLDMFSQTPHVETIVLLEHN